MLKNKNGQELVIVSVSGYFDPLTPGHVEYLYKAKELGDRLIVILNRDDQLLAKRVGTKLEGIIRYPFADRKAIISTLKPVDEVVECIDRDTSVAETIEMIKPHIFAKGGDRDISNIPPKEIEACRRSNCRIVCGVGEKTHSSSWYNWEDTSKCLTACDIKPQSDFEKRAPLKIVKPWGYEVLFAFTPKYAGKVLFIKKGHRLSLQYHNDKDETLYVLKGKGLLEIERDDRQLCSRDFM